MPRRTTKRLAVAALTLAVVAGRRRPGRLASPRHRRHPASRPRILRAAQVRTGEQLALVGNCVTCHQAAGRAAYAGGLALATPFGTVYSANITPDERTGIGAWSREAFRRAMRAGVSRDGHYLYPALPYTHFTRVTDADLDALYAFLMTRPPVAATPAANRLIPPFGFRPLLAGWDWLFCARACGTPRPASRTNGTGAPTCRWVSPIAAPATRRATCWARRSAARATAAAGRRAGTRPPSTRHSPARRAWTSERLFAYLRTGLDTNHAAAAGPMGPVTYNLARVSEADVRAIAAYTATMMTGAPAAAHPDAQPIDRRAQAERAYPTGATLYASACAACHGGGAPMMSAGRPSLSLGSPLWEDDPRDTIAIILRGLKPPVGRAGPYMPAFGDAFGDAEVGALAAYVQARYSDRPGWST